MLPEYFIVISNRFRPPGACSSVLGGLLLLGLGLAPGRVQGRLLHARDPEAAVENQRDFRSKYRAAAGFPFRARLSTDLPLRIRLGIMSGQGRIEFRTEANSTIQVGSKTFRSPAGSRWSILHLEGSAAVTRSRALLARVPYGHGAEARRMQQDWEARGHDVKVFPMGILLTDRRSGRRLNDSRCWFVTLEPEVSWTAAWNRCIELTAQGVNPTVYEEMVSAPSGRMALVDQRGKVQARGSSVEIQSPGEIKVYRVEHDQDLPQHGYEDRSFQGNIHVDVGQNGKLAVSTSLDLESYIKGVVPSEIYASDPMETIKAEHTRFTAKFEGGLPEHLPGLLRKEEFNGEWTLLSHGNRDACRAAITEHGGAILEENDPSLEDIFVAHAGAPMQPSEV